MKFNDWALGTFIFTVCVVLIILIICSSPQRVRADKLPATGVVSGESFLKEWVEALCEDRNVPLEIVLAIIAHESGGDSNAVNETSGAAGLMQIVPGTWDAQVTAIQEELGRNVTLNPLDPYDNVFVGICLLSYLLEGRELELALDCYALGEGGAAERMVSMDKYEPTDWTKSVINYANELVATKLEKENLKNNPHKQEVKP